MRIAAVMMFASLPFALGARRAVRVDLITPPTSTTVGADAPVRARSCTWPQGDKPLIIVDGERFAPQAMLDEDMDRIASMHVIKAPEAVKRFGEAARNGAVLIITKGPPA